MGKFDFGRKPWVIATAYGFAAGAVAALTLVLMMRVQHLLWAHAWADAPFYILTVILAGTVLLAWLQKQRGGGTAHDGNMEAQLAALHDPAHIKRRDIALIAAGAVVAVAFGGAVGPEAGLLAVVAECSALVSLKLAENAREQRLIRDTGAVAALSGLYGAPPGAAVWVDEREDGGSDAEATPLMLKLAAGVCGLAGFWGVHNLFSDGKGFQQLPLPEHVANGGADVLGALLPALAGAGLGMLLLAWCHRMPAVLKRVQADPVKQIWLAGGVFALAAAVFPLLRFSGHHELEHALAHGIHMGAWALLALALGKAAVTALCLAGGWRGGAFFPAVFAAGALAAAVCQLLPTIPLTVAVLAAGGAVATVIMGKPMTVLLIMLLIAGAPAPAALLTGVLIGYAARRLPFCPPVLGH